ncbi:restriction modification system DNA specificity domain protein [Thermus scotoductus SA-01]|uniref:Restriction modification system DNA specificity domain protein n=1 Tax=Thermus scotoductus (strain ATCC 700910 / SA-01) TaxID=743525 RepID=E8PNG8_THESS|nr:restriction modification system DNA specificity domain protein [Thermus scotoductus SA-01]
MNKYEAGLVSPVYPVWEVKPDKAYAWFIDPLLRMPNTISAYNRFASGAVNRRRAIRKNDFLSIPIPLPPLLEQRAIAHVLRTVQEAKQATERVIAALRDLKKSLMRHLFTYGPVSIGEQHTVPLQETEIGPIPAHWRVVRLGELVAKGILWMKNGFPQGKHNRTASGVPHLRPFNITDTGDITLSQVKYVPPPPEDSPYRVFPGDVIFNNTNSEELVGKTAYFDRNGTFVISNHMTLIRVLSGEVNPYWLSKYLHWLWSKGVFRNLCRRHVNQASVSLERLKQVTLPLPPLPEQRAIAHVLRTVDRRIAAEEAYARALGDLFKSLLQELMTGRRRVKVAAEEVTQSSPGGSS